TGRMYFSLALSRHADASRICFCLPRSPVHRDLLSFPTRRSSDLVDGVRNLTTACSDVHSYFMYLSTDFVFSGAYGPLREEDAPRSEEHTSELQSRENLVCRLLLEKKNKRSNTIQQ